MSYDFSRLRNVVVTFSNFNITVYKYTYPSFYTSPSGNNLFAPTLNDDDGALIPVITSSNHYGDIQVIEPETSEPDREGAIVEQELIFISNDDIEFYDADVNDPPFDVFMVYENRMYKIKKKVIVQNNILYEYHSELDRSQGLPA